MVSCPHAHQQNGSAERKHRHIVEVGLALFAEASMPLKYWDQAFLAALYLINRLPSKVIQNMIPLEHLLGRQVDYNSLRVFGCACWPNLRPYNSHKLQFRSKRCVNHGFSNLHKGYKCLDVSTGRIYVSRDVIFYEEVFPFALLHDNAGARLRSEISLLPPLLLNPSFLGEMHLHDHVQNIHTNATNTWSSSLDVSSTGFRENSGENPVQNDISLPVLQTTPGARHEIDAAADPDGASVRGSGESPLGLSRLPPTPTELIGPSARVGAADARVTGSSAGSDVQHERAGIARIRCGKWRYSGRIGCGGCACGRDRGCDDSA